jgi:hypothetical protein
MTCRIFFWGSAAASETFDTATTDHRAQRRHWAGHGPTDAEKA